MLKKLLFKLFNRLKPLISRNFWLLNWYSFISVRKFSLKYFSGKRVAIIGPADSALKEKLGIYIDDFDIVIRINKSLDNIDLHHAFIGSKTTVLFHGLDETPISGCGEIDIIKWKMFGVKKVFYPLNEKRLLFNLHNYFLKNRGDIPIHQINDKFYKKLQKLINNYTPTTGFGALYVLLHSNCAELYISGFTFFKTPHQTGYRNEINHKDALQLIKDYGNHNPDIEFEVFKEKVANSKLNIKLDKTLQELVYERK
jgi:hypothetical protein